MHGKEAQVNVEAASETSHILTETVSRRDLASLNGRRRGTKDFLGRVAHTTQSRTPNQKAGATDPVDVFGAASAAAAWQTNLRRGRQRLTCLSFRDTAKKEGIILQIPGCAY